MKIKLGQIIMHLVLVAGALAAILPFVWMFLASFKTYQEVYGGTWLPSVWRLDNYIEITGRVGFPVAFRNSALVAIPATGAVLLTSSAAGYVFSKYDFRGKELVFTAILATLMVPFTTVIIPLFLTMRDLGLINKLEGILVTSLCSTFGIFMMRQTIEGVPNDYIDAGRVDGASEAWIFFRVILPLVRPALATLAVFTFLGNWDSYMWPSILLKTPDQQTLPIVMASLRSLYRARYHIWAAASMMTVVPTMLLFAFTQKHFVRGLTLSGIK